MNRWRTSRTIWSVGLIALFATTTLGSGAVADRGDISRDDLSALEAELKETRAKLEAIEAAETDVTLDLQSLEQNLIAAALESQRREEQASASELKLITLRTELDVSQRNLLEGEEALDGLVASLAAAGRRRPPALIIHPSDANKAIRTAVLMSHVAPDLKDKTDALTVQIEKLRKLERQVLRERKQLEVAEAALSLKQSEITKMTAAKRAAYTDVSQDAERLRQRLVRLTNDTETMRDLIAAIEKDAPAPRLKPKLRYAATVAPKSVISDAPKRRKITPRATGPGLAQSGQLRRPVVGRQVYGWGDSRPGGDKSKGAAFATRPSAQVIAPVDGIIERSQKFRTYGELLIISTSDGYYIVLSGMAERYVSVGQAVKRGEPVAKMANRVDPAPELYLEVRKNLTPIDPDKWMKTG